MTKKIIDDADIDQPCPHGDYRSCVVDDCRPLRRPRVAAAPIAHRARKVTEGCPSHPEDDGQHECLPTEMCCAYCGARLAPYPCNGCGRFLTAAQMHAASNGEENWRCDHCQ